MFFNLKSTKTTFALAAAALMLPGMAHAEDYTVHRDGITYVYTVKTEKDRTVISGKANTYTPFRLVLRGDKVRGEYNGRPVEFTLQDVERTAETVAVR